MTVCLFHARWSIHIRSSPFTLGTNRTGLFQEFMLGLINSLDKALFIAVVLALLVLFLEGSCTGPSFRSASDSKFVLISTLLFGGNLFGSSFKSTSR